MLAASGAESTRQWERMQEVSASELVDADVISVQQRDGYIYVSNSRTVEVKVFSIVGRLISQAELKPGISRLKMNTKGLYIVKIGEKTLKIAV